MSRTAIERVIARVVLGALAVLPVPALAITGGVSVDAILASAGRQEAGPELVSTARALASVTVALVTLDAQERVRSLCSATLIHPRVVLTAAHCVFERGQDSSFDSPTFAATPATTRAPLRAGQRSSWSPTTGTAQRSMSATAIRVGRYLSSNAARPGSARSQLRPRETAATWRCSRRSMPSEPRCAGCSTP